MKGHKKIVLFDIDNTLFNTLEFKKSNLTKFSLYEEVIDVLTKLSKEVDLGIFSEGVIAFQKKKLQETNIENYFLREHIHIVPQKIAAIEMLVEKYKNGNQLYLIDDKLEALFAIKQHFPSIVTIWIKRGEYAPYQEPLKDFTPDEEIEELQDVIPLIIKN
jgi:FMN phosphatase YigB (HAD superfamily)